MSMKKATAWIEAVTFIECPYCELPENLGDASWDGEEPMICNECGREFIAVGPDV